MSNERQTKRYITSKIFICHIFTETSECSTEVLRCWTGHQVRERGEVRKRESATVSPLDVSSKTSTINLVIPLLHLYDRERNKRENDVLDCIYQSRGMTSTKYIKLL